MNRWWMVVALLCVACGGNLKPGDICEKNGECDSGECLIVDLTIEGSCKRCASNPCSSDTECAEHEQCVTPAGRQSSCFDKDVGCP